MDLPLSGETPTLFCLAAFLLSLVVLVVFMLTENRQKRPRMGVIVHGAVLATMIALLASMVLLPGGFVDGTNSPVARVETDHRQLAAALEAYYLDHQQYPATLSSLTAPKPYLATIPKDPFPHQGEQGKQDYDYFLVPSHCWVLRSVGRDGQRDMDLTTLEPVHCDARAFEQAVNQDTYDPTNGLDSRGDIYRLGP